MISVNQRALTIVRRMMDDAAALSITVTSLQNGATVIDTGVEVPGSLEAGRLFAAVCLGGLARINFCNLNFGEVTLPGVSVAVDHPTLSCMGSQYAGWALKVKGAEKADSYFAMGVWTGQGAVRQGSHFRGDRLSGSGGYRRPGVGESKTA